MLAVQAVFVRHYSSGNKKIELLGSAAQETSNAILFFVLQYSALSRGFHLNWFVPNILSGTC